MTFVRDPDVGYDQRHYLDQETVPFSQWPAGDAEAVAARLPQLAGG